MRFELEGIRVATKKYALPAMVCRVPKDKSVPEGNVEALTLEQRAGQDDAQRLNLTASGPPVLGAARRVVTPRALLKPKVRMNGVLQEAISSARAQAIAARGAVVAQFPQVKVVGRSARPNVIRVALGAFVPATLSVGTGSDSRRGSAICLSAYLGLRLGWDSANRTTNAARVGIHESSERHRASKTGVAAAMSSSTGLRKGAESYLTMQ